MYNYDLICFSETLLDSRISSGSRTCLKETFKFHIEKLGCLFLQTGTAQCYISETTFENKNQGYFASLYRSPLQYSDHFDRFLVEFD